MDRDSMFEDGVEGALFSRHRHAGRIGRLNSDIRRSVDHRSHHVANLSDPTGVTHWKFSTGSYQLGCLRSQIVQPRRTGR